MPAPLDPQTIIAEAERLIAQVQRQIEDGEDVLRDMGLDPAKVAQVTASQLSEKERIELDAQLQADLAAIEQEVKQELLRLQHAAPQSNNRPARLRRSMI